LTNPLSVLISRDHIANRPSHQRLSQVYSLEKLSVTTSQDWLPKFEFILVAMLVPRFLVKVFN